MSDLATDAGRPDVLLQPIFLLADSQLLFYHSQDMRLAECLHNRSADPISTLKAAYIGASNQDRPEFYDIFVAAMEGMGIRDCRQVLSSPSPDDYAYLDESSLILLAGGDVEAGWMTFKKTGLDLKLIERYYSGAILVGISAGAVQLGLRGWKTTASDPPQTFSTLQLVPFVVDVHDEPEWLRMKQIVSDMGGAARGLGISSGGGAVFYPDYSLEPLRHPLVELNVCDDGLRQGLLFPNV